MVVALTLVVLIGFVGLAVDSGLAYLVRAKFNAAADAAVVAGTFASSRGATEAERRANATAAANKFFNANFPADYLGATVTSINPAITYDSSGLITMDMDVRATMPSALMGVFGFNQLNIDASARTIRKDLDLAFVLDMSRSLEAWGGSVKEQATTFLDKLHPDIDRVALVRFGSGAVVDVGILPSPPNSLYRGFNREEMKAKIRDYSFEGSTNSSEGFWLGWNELNKVPAAIRSSMRVIVFFSDGSPNTFSSTFRFVNPACNFTVGAIVTPDLETGSEDYKKRAKGLYRHNLPEAAHSGPTAACFRNPAANMTDPGIAPLLRPNALPLTYNAHGPSSFPVVTSEAGRRRVENRTETPENVWKNVNRASKNLVEAMAEEARKEGIYVFTLGLGDKLHAAELASLPEMPNDTGENLLKCMANTIDAPSRCRKPDQLTGVYCHAATAEELEPCFASLAAEILRITR